MRADQKDEPKFQLFHQLTRITRDRDAVRHDDRRDARAMAVAYWSNYLNRDVSREEDKRMEELMELEYAKFAESVLGHRPSAPNYFDNY